MRRLTLALACPALLTGCLYNVAELREVGSRQEITRPSDPETLANCIGRNMVAIGYPSSVLKGAQPKTWEFSLHTPTTLHTAIVAGQVVPEGSGSRATMYVTPVNSDPAGVLQLLTKGC